MIKGTISKSWIGYTSQLPSCVTRRFMRNRIAAIVQMAVVVPTRGKVPIMMPLAMLSASIWGVRPCFSREIMGKLTYLLKNPWAIIFSAVLDFRLFLIFFPLFSTEQTLEKQA